jgi:hypothetical protein
MVVLLRERGWRLRCRRKKERMSKGEGGGVIGPVY